jgi:lipopolysaccharide export system protein LptA
MRRPLLLGALGALLPLSVAAGQPASGRCVLVFPQGQNGPANLVKQPSGNYNAFIGRGVFARCEGQNVTLRADSAEYYQDVGVVYLIGSVRYEEPRVTMTSRRATYYQNDERVLAEGDVVTTMPSGTVMRGPRMDYYRAIPGIRARSRMIATGRPRTELVQMDSLGRPQEPVDIVANTVVTEADSLVYASGKVEISRPDVRATSDSAFLDSGREYGRLIRNPVIRGQGERPFELRGRVIELFSRNRLLQRVLASGDGRATSEDIDLASDTIDMRLGSDRKLEVAYAWGASRAHATSPSSEIVADSIEILMPGQRVREVRAIGGAVAHGTPDSTRVRTTERDWLRGEAIVAYFDTTAATAPASDTAARRARIERLVATGSASAFYHVAPQNPNATCSGINYARGREIVVHFADGQARTVLVREKAVGIYLDPLPVPAPDSAAADSAAVDGAAAPPPRASCS